jgi:DNA-binding LacI/PurR family transcriptional regulator
MDSSMSKANRTVTSFDVARIAEVSQSAVSRTFTKGASVSDETRERVLAAARLLGYRPNAHARSLITKRSRIIGLVLSYLENLFYPIAIQRLSERLQKDGYHVLLFFCPQSSADEVVDEILQYHVDGIVLASVTLSSTLARRCSDANIPVVMFNRVHSVTDRQEASAVTSDNYRGCAAVARLLVDSGHRRVAFISGQEESSTSRERERGFREELARLGSRIWSRGVGNYDFTQAKVATRDMFSREDRPDAVFVASDHMAFAVMDTLRFELGLRIPEDVSVVGFDDVPQAAWLSYNLTTVRQPVEEMVEHTVQILQTALRDDGELKPSTVVVPAMLIQRGTVRRGP